MSSIFCLFTPNCGKFRQQIPFCEAMRAKKEHPKNGCFLELRVTGVEPARLLAQDPKSCVYASFTTPADILIDFSTIVGGCQAFTDFLNRIPHFAECLSDLAKPQKPA